MPYGSYEGRGVVLAFVLLSVDEERWGPGDSEIDPRGAVGVNLGEMSSVYEIAREPVTVQTELACVPGQIVVFELVLAVEQEVVHLPEASLCPRCLCRKRGPFRERVNVVLGEVTEHEADLGHLRTARRSVDRSLTRVEAATSANWEQAREGVNRAVQNLSESIEAAQPK